MTSDVSRILWYYYNNSTTLFIFCAGNELCFVGLYLMKWDQTLLSAYPSVGFFVPTLLGSFTFAEVLTMATAPICIAKNIINIIQLWKARYVLSLLSIGLRGPALGERASFWPARLVSTARRLGLRASNCGRGASNLRPPLPSLPTAY